MPDVELDYRLSIHDSSVPRSGPNGWSAPVNKRLDHFVEQANSAGARTNRKEVLGAIVAGLQPVPEVLLDWVQAYRTTTVGEVDPGRDPTSATGRFTVRTAGRIRGS